MRVYLPSTVEGLERLAAQGTLGAGPHLACAVTPALRRWYGSEDLDELEWAAAEEAALASVRLIDSLGAGPYRRVVLPLDVADSAVHPAGEEEGPAAVRLAAEVVLGDVASLHVDDVSAEPAVRAAVAAVRSYDDGDAAAAATIEALDAHALDWFATQELPDLLVALRG